MIKKKIFSAFLVLMLLVTSVLAAGCESHRSSNDADTTKILCAAFPEYDWTLQLLGENPADIEITLLNESGMDMHSYQPSVADMVELADSDLIIFTGGESEFWIKDALASYSSDARETLSFMEIFAHDHHLADAYSAEDDDSHDHDHDHDHENDGHAHSTDEHLWLSLKMAPAFIDEISGALGRLDPSNAEYYADNAAKYIEKIQALDGLFEEAVSEAQHNMLLFADRYPFKYFLEDYDLDYTAAFPGCSAETEASFSTILSLSETLDRLNLNSVAVLKKTDTALAQTIIKNSAAASAEIITFDSMQSVTAKDIKAGTSWLSIMENNLEALKQALN